MPKFARIDPLTGRVRVDLLPAWGGAGVTGDKGPQGAKGPQGDAGAQGPVGNQGDVGTQGGVGTQGATGDKGPQGDAGAQGPAGDPAVIVAATISDADTNHAPSVDALFHALATKAASLGADDNYVTDAEKAALHAAATVSAPIAVTGQALSIVNDAAATVTEVDTGALGNVDTTIPTSKVVTTAIAAHSALRVGIHGVNASYAIVPQGTPNAETTGAVTVHIADMLKGIVTGTPNAARAYTLDTGANCDAGMTINVDEAFDWVLINLDTTAADIITLTASAGHTIVGSVKIPSNSTTTGGLWGTCGATLRTRKTAANTFVTYRIG